MCTSLPMYTPCPSEQAAPMRAPALTCTKCQTRVPAPSCAPSSTKALGWMVTVISEHQRQPDAHAVARAAVGGEHHFQRAQAAVAVDLGVLLAAQRADDVVVVQRVARAVDRRCRVAGGLDGLVLGPHLVEGPVL